MIFVNLVNLASLVLEAAVVILALKIAVVNRQNYGWLIALTFVIYVIYDLGRFLRFYIPAGDVLFLIASASICWAVWKLAKNK
jgi:hypothetical protein